MSGSGTDVGHLSGQDAAAAVRQSASLFLFSVTGDNHLDQQPPSSSSAAPAAAAAAIDM